ncbi:phosphatase PAP2 family protein [Lactobacillus sp. DCY120]|uniref:Phosphatase PAP2 family protein n=1 Tax=Bombilactobacillus apium TaxID=2675299 RepID=A0A850QZR2_9LACO|nr:phosphatase PAP2 family protein [Bombilactobacillus apium]NVY96279.1 phosphatase PAP2 family protein [Bombilactobacillus apium]
MKSKTLLFSGLSCLSIFGLLALGVIYRFSGLQTFDDHSLQLATQTITPLKTAILQTISLLGSPRSVVILTVLLCIYLWLRKQRILSLEIASFQSLGALAVILIKNSIARPRPSQQLMAASGFSFPSGHTFGTTTLILILILLLLPRLSTFPKRFLVSSLGLIGIIIVAYSRVYLHNHFPSDVLAGFFLALAYIFLGNYLRKKFRTSF